MTEEVWRVIHGHRMYSVSNFGRILNNVRDRLVATSQNNHGHVKVSLWSDVTGHRHTRSVALLVARAFCKKPDPLCDHPMILDNNLLNVAADNIVWRPNWFVWKYSRQFEWIPHHYVNLPIINLIEDITYNSVVECGMTEGLLFQDIWDSTWGGRRIYPHQNVYQVLK